MNIILPPPPSANGQPVLQLLQLKAELGTKEFRSDQAIYDTVIGNLDSETLQYISDTVLDKYCAPSELSKYD